MKNISKLTVPGKEYLCCTIQTVTLRGTVHGRFRPYLYGSFTYDVGEFQEARYQKIRAPSSSQSCDLEADPPLHRLILIRPIIRVEFAVQGKMATCYALQTQCRAEKCALALPPPRRAKTAPSASTANPGWRKVCVPARQSADTLGRFSTPFTEPAHALAAAIL